MRHRRSSSATKTSADVSAAANANRPEKEDVYADEEGVETIRNMASNMVFLMKSIQDGAKTYGIPETKHEHFTNFIR